MNKRALFFPSYRGSGFGHVGRCLALAEEMDRQGWKIAFVLGGPHADRVAARWTVFSLSPLPLSARLWRRFKNSLRRFRPAPAFMFFSDLNFQAVRDGFHTPQIVQRQVEWELDIVHRFRPHVLIGDVWLPTFIVGRRAGLPVVQIVRAAAYPTYPNLVWWRSPHPQVLAPDVAPVFNPLLEQWGLPLIRRAEDLLDGDLLLIPSIPELDPLPPDVQRTRYVGPLIRGLEGGRPAPDWLTALPRERPVIYVTVGGASDSVYGLDLIPLWQAAFESTGWQVVISTGGRRPPRSASSHDVLIFSWVPGPAMVNRADVVVFHGGYGTMMETVRAGVPSVIFPFHTEQESNGRRLEQSGAARVLAPGDEHLKPVESLWQGKKFTVLTCQELAIHPAQVREAVTAILGAASCRANAIRLQKAQAAYGGPSQAVEYIEALGIS